MTNSQLLIQCAHYFSEEPDPGLRAQIEELQDDKSRRAELYDRIFNYLRFGTAGLRARMEAGYNRMNIPTVYRFAYALAFLCPKSRVVIAFDARYNSLNFAHEIASVLSKMGLDICIFSEAIPTPLCAFTTQDLRAQWGVMVTASHNPAYDNGIKLYDHQGAQAHGAILAQIEERMTKAPLREDFYKKYPQNIKFNNINNNIFEKYFTHIKSYYFFKNNILDKNISVSYTALHGVGHKFFMPTALDIGFMHIDSVADQAEPDGNFPTLSFPNPEEEGALNHAYALARTKKLEWIFAHDPDADRLQVCALDAKNQMRKLSGNEMGVIMGFFAITKALQSSHKPLVATSIVSSRMLKAIALALGAEYIDALTGFSNIVAAALKVQKESVSRLVFAYEEAIGFLIGHTILDKDGINAALRFLEIAAYLKFLKKNIWDFLDELYLRFGLFVNEQWSLRFSGPESYDAMAALMNKWRALTREELEHILTIKNLSIYDLKQIQASGAYAGINANMIIFEHGSDFRLIIRPSGTEPKIKFYCELSARADKNNFNMTKKIITEHLHKLRKDIESII
jgi:phosphomannomutase